MASKVAPTKPHPAPPRLWGTAAAPKPKITYHTQRPQKSKLPSLGNKRLFGLPNGASNEIVNNLLKGHPSNKLVLEIMNKPPQAKKVSIPKEEKKTELVY